MESEVEAECEVSQKPKEKDVQGGATVTLQLWGKVKEGNPELQIRRCYQQQREKFQHTTEAES